MAYRLKRSEPVSDGVKRVARRELKKAAGQLHDNGARGREAHIHEARKSIKKVRALFRLIQDELGDGYTRDSGRLREAGQSLSPVRDAGAMITAFDRLVKRRNIRKRDAAPMRRGLIEHRARLEEELGLAELMAGAARKLVDERRSVKIWKVKRDGFRVIENGLKKTFRRGRKAFCTALKTGHREDLHEFRKRVKDHWYQVRLLGGQIAYERNLKRLEDSLGEYLNLEMLRDHAIGAPPLLLEALLDEETKLRKRALDIGGEIYHEKPAAIVRMLRKTAGAKKK